METFHSYFVFPLAFGSWQYCRYSWNISSYYTLTRVISLIYIWTPQPITLPHSRCACGVIKYNSCIFMVKLRNYFFRKQNSTQASAMWWNIVYLHEITRVNKLKNKTKFNTNINNVMKCCLPSWKSQELNSGAPDIHFFPVLHSSSLVCKQRHSVPRQVPSQFTKWRYLPMELCDIILRTNRVRCALDMEILDLLNEESVSGERFWSAQW